MSFFSQSRRVGCHTAYEHYEMFHGHKACGGSRSSIFNVVYNTHHCCGGSSWGGGFWGGIGMGLGMGSANLFSGLLGNIFGGFGFGFPSFGGGWGDFGLGGHNLSSRNTNNSHNCTDKDLDNINKLWDKVRNVADESTAKSLNTQIKGLIDRPLDDTHKADNKTSYENLLKDLQRIADEKGWNLEGTQKAKEKAQPVPDNKPKQTTEVKPKETVATAAVPAADNKTKINGATSLDELLKLTPTTDEEKKAFVDKYVALNPKPTADDLAKIDEALRKLIKQKLYGDYTNYDGKTKLKDGDVTLANDTSGNTNNTVNIGNKVTKIVTSSTGNHPETITIYDTKTVTYTYQKIVDGEYIYKSDKGGQLYALQKTTDGKYKLKQYSWHNGYGTKDWS